MNQLARAVPPSSISLCGNSSSSATSSQTNTRKRFSIFHGEGEENTKFFERSDAIAFFFLENSVAYVLLMILSKTKFSHFSLSHERDRFGSASSDVEINEEIFRSEKK